MWGFVVDSRCMSIEAEILRTPYLRISTQQILSLKLLRICELLDNFVSFQCLRVVNGVTQSLSFGGLVILSRIFNI